jgi:hypothetical protein
MTQVSGGGFRFVVDTTGSFVSSYFTTTASHTLVFSVGATSTRLRIAALGGASFSIDNVSVRELPGNHAFNPNATTVRPVLKADGALRYLEFGGVDDWLQTASIDFSATDAVSVFVGLRKSSDGERGTVVELTTSATANDGAFHLTAPNAASATIAFESKGTTLTDAVVSSNVAAPITVVATGLADISTPNNTLRISGVQADTDGGSQGSGNYANAAMYIGRRAGSSLPFNGWIYSLIVRGATSTADEIAQAETYVAAKTGVTL